MRSISTARSGRRRATSRRPQPVSATHARPASRRATASSTRRRSRSCSCRSAAAVPARCGADHGRADRGRRGHARRARSARLALLRRGVPLDRRPARHPAGRAHAAARARAGARLALARAGARRRAARADHRGQAVPLAAHDLARRHRAVARRPARRRARRRRERARLGDHRLRRARRLPEAPAACSRTPSRAAATRSSRPGLWLGLGPAAARAAAVALGAGLLALCWREGRRGFDERSLALALAAALALSPIVWLHYFVLLLVPIALARRTFGADLAHTGALLAHALRGALRRPLAYRGRHRGRGAGARRSGARGARRRTLLRHDALLESREPRRRRPRHPVLPGRRLRRLRACGRRDLDRRERRDRRRRLRKPGAADVREPRDDARGGRLQRGGRRPRHDLPDRPR